MRTPLQIIGRQTESAFTWIEALVSLSVIAVLAVLVLPALTYRGCGGPMTSTLSNLKQLHLATQSMAIDGIAMSNSKLQWPGDREGTYSAWVDTIVPAYLSTSDFCKLSTAPGKNVPVGKLPARMSDGAVLVYAAREDSKGDAVFLSSANFTNTPEGGLPLDVKAKPFGDKGFVVFRIGGDGAILLEKQVGETNKIGSFVPLLR
jgi:type II secretory pathway pseudopilin PulG